MRHQKQQKQRTQPGDSQETFMPRAPKYSSGAVRLSAGTARAGTPRSTDDRADRSCQGLFLSIVSGRQQGKGSWPVIRPRRTFPRRRKVDRWVYLARRGRDMEEECDWDKGNGISIRFYIIYCYLAYQPPSNPLTTL